MKILAWLKCLFCRKKNEATNLELNVETPKMEPLLRSSSSEGQAVKEQVPEHLQRLNTLIEQKTKLAIAQGMSEGFGKKTSESEQKKFDEINVLLDEEIDKELHKNVFVEEQHQTPRSSRNRRKREM